MYPSSRFPWTRLFLPAIVAVLSLIAPAALRPTQASQASWVELPSKLAEGDVIRMWLSPDGKYCVFVALRDGEYSLWSVPTRGGDPAQLSLAGATGVNDLWPAISPDSSRVVYSARQPGDVNEQLYVAPIAGGTPTTLTQDLAGNGSVVWYTVSSDGRYVVFDVESSSSDARHSLWSVPLAGGAPVRLWASSAGTQYLQTYAVSPDSTRVVAVADEPAPPVGGRVALYSMPIAGGATVKLDAFERAEGEVFQFTPDGSRVVYRRTAATTYAHELWVVSAAGGTPALIAATNGLVLDEFLQLSSDSAYIVYTVRDSIDSKNALFSARLTPGQPPSRLSDPELSVGESWPTQDGKRVVYTSQRAGGLWDDETPDLRSVPIAGGTSISLMPDGVETIDPQFRLAPDGSRVLIQDATTGFLYSAPVDGSGAAVNLTPTLPQSASILMTDAGFSRDISHVFYRVTQDDGALLFDLRMQPATGGQAMALNSGVGTVGGSHFYSSDASYLVSPDGRQVVFRAAATRIGPRLLYIVDLPVSHFRLYVPAAAR